MSELLQFQHFHFLRPYWLLMILPSIWIIKSFRFNDDNLAIWRTQMSKPMLAALTVKGSASNLFSPRNMSSVLVVLLTIVLAGPTWYQQPSPFTQDKSALIIALDVSKSMESTDIEPNRLLRAKQKILQLLEIRGDSNTALIAYSGSAHIVMPITNDREMISHFLDVLEPKLMPKPGKSAEQILPLTSSLLAPTGVPGTVLLLTDGVNSQTSSAFEAFFDIQAHQLIIWAIGNNDIDKAVQKQADLIPLQLAQLNSLKQQSNGRLVPISIDNSDVLRVNKYIQNNLVIVDDESRPWHDSGYPLVVLIAMIYLLWFRKGWTLQW